MFVNVQTVVDSKRGCGWRKDGALYLRADGELRGCGKLPLPLGVCPTCHGGIKPTRGWTWVDVQALFAGAVCRRGDCAGCPLDGDAVRLAGLLWVGWSFYPTPQDFLRESAAQGLSRRIATIPRKFVVGATWVLLAHRKAVQRQGADTRGPGIFSMVLPSRIEYVVHCDDTVEKLERLAERGVTLVKIDRVASAEQANKELEEQEKSKGTLLELFTKLDSRQN